MNGTPLYTSLIEHQKKGLSPFHTPGHKCSGFIKNALLLLDLTELPDTDALYEADGVIMQAEKGLAELFGTVRTLISAGGCTLAIQAMLRIASIFSLSCSAFISMTETLFSSTITVSKCSAA